MFKKILQSALFLSLFFAWQITKAETILTTQTNFQKIKIEKNDFNHWIQAPAQFTSLAVKADQTENLTVIFNPANPQEQSLIFEEDNYSELLFTNPTKNFLITTKNNAIPENLTVYLFDTRESSSQMSEFSAGETSSNGLKIISRAQWGADENLRYYNPDETEDDESAGDGGGGLTAACQKKVDAYPNEFKYAKTVDTENGHALIWPLQYSASIQKIVVHHTGETDVTNGRPSDEMVRAIYYYHTVVKGWGDIGYNYVIGKDGEIYEGKAGGDKVVGAHVYCNNINTVGVSVMGNFNLQEPSTKQLNSLKALLAQLTKKYNLDPIGFSIFHGENIPNIIGHRDLAATACPGTNLYGKLTSVRQDVAKGFTYNFTEETSDAQKDYEATVEKKVEVLNLDPTHQKTVIFNFKNTGKQAWNETTWLHVALNNNANAWAENIVPDKKFVAADMREKTVKPGQTATFEVTLNAGYKAGFYILEFAPVVNNKYKLSKSAILQPINIAEPTFNYSFVNAKHPPNPFYAEEQAEAWVELKNTGNIVWRNYGENKIYLGTQKPQDRKSLFSSDGRRTRLGYLEEREVYPGQIGHFVMPLTAPERRGIYTESFAPVIEGIRWLNDLGMQFRITVKEPTHKIQFTTASNLVNLNPETNRVLTISYQNLSDVSWKEDQVYFLIGGAYEALGIENNIVQLSEPLGKKGKGSFKLEIKTPLKNGVYKLTVVPVIRGKKFTDAEPFTLQIIVKKPTASGEIVGSLPKIINAEIDKLEIVTIKIRNTSNFTWKKEKTNLIALNQKSRLFVAEKWASKQIVGAMNENEVETNKIATFTLYLQTQNRGYFTDVFRVRIDGFGYVNGITIPLRVKSIGTSTGTNPTTTTTTPTAEVETPNLGGSTGINLIRVKLSVPKTDTTELTADQNYIINDGDQKKLFSVTKGEKAIIKKIGNYLHIQVGTVNKVSTIARFVPSNTGIMEIGNWEHRPAWNQSLNDNRFRGTIELRIVDNEPVVINELPLEDYLKGIAEVSNNDPTEKLKTMAVLARTYALFYLQPENEKFPGKPYDASDDPDVFQKYLGYGLELRSPNFVKAIEATKNEIVKYNGKLVKTPYFNQSDGKTLSAQEVWGWNNTPYLVSVEDPDCKEMKRNGHGVGLSGYGATKKAERGETYQQIIKYYYSGVSIEKM